MEGVSLEWHFQTNTGSKLNELLQNTIIYEIN